MGSAWHYSFGHGNKAYVKISNKDADGVVLADAVIFVPVQQPKL